MLRLLFRILPALTLGLAAFAQTPALPRAADGKPDLSGIWQALNTADWDLQDHQARPDAPAGQGVVVGNDIPYRPEALAKKRQNFAARATADPLSKCDLPGVPRITYTPLPFQIFPNVKADPAGVPIRARSSLPLY